MLEEQDLKDMFPKTMFGTMLRIRKLLREIKVCEKSFTNHEYKHITVSPQPCPSCTTITVLMLSLYPYIYDQTFKKLIMTTYDFLLAIKKRFRLNFQSNFHLDPS